MQYSPKLKTAMDRIKAILKEYDINATVCLHTPGFSELLMKVDASYSCAKIEGDVLRIKAKLQEDFNGDKEAWNKKVADTVNMIVHFQDINGQLFMQADKAYEMLKKHIDIENDRGNISSHTTQNN